MIIQDLTHTNIPTLTRIFNEAFAGYYVPINFTEAGMHFRIQRGRIDLSLSVGVFDEGQLVAFILSGADDWEGQRTIYNAGTGVLPSYRGKQLVDQMYVWGVPRWKAAAYTLATLEVMTQNERAIRAYQRVGMKFERKLLSFKSPDLGKDALVLDAIYTLNEEDTPEWSAYEPLLGFVPSWDFCQQGVVAVESTCRFFALRQKGDQSLRGYVIVNNKQQIAQAGVSEAGEWKMLLSQLQTRYSSNLQWINIDDRAEALLSSIANLGWTSIINQYEMKMKI